jgi:hypothetical protein
MFLLAKEKFMINIKDIYFASLISLKLLQTKLLNLFLKAIYFKF